jgi:hypothetical protein
MNFYCLFFLLQIFEFSYSSYNIFMLIKLIDEWF